MRQIARRPSVRHAMVRPTRATIRPMLPDYLEPNLSVVFVGTSVATASAARGHYYAGPGNKFWELLWEAGLTADRMLSPEQMLGKMRGPVATVVSVGRRRCIRPERMHATMGGRARDTSGDLRRTLKVRLVR